MLIKPKQNVCNQPRIAAKSLVTTQNITTTIHRHRLYEIKMTSDKGIVRSI